MKAKCAVIFTVALALAFGIPGTDSSIAGEKSDLPEGWFAAGMSPQEYHMGVDATVSRSGRSGFIKSKETPHAFGTLMQMCKADTYLNKRVRMSAYVKTENVEKWAGLWMRVDGSQGKSLSFDNMQDRQLKGTIDWKRYEIVLDVPANSVNLAFGLLLNGRGQAWVDDVRFEVVGADVATTGTKQQETYPKEPLNLSFE